MKQIATIFVIMLIGIQYLAAQAQQPVNTAQPAQNAQSVPAAKPVDKEKTYSWNENIHDCGKIPVGEPVTVTYSVKNTGEAPILITAAKSSCGCTVAEYTKEPIKPGESGIVKATYNAARAGAFAKTVTVTFEGWAVGDVLTIKGEVVEKSTN